MPCSHNKNEGAVGPSEYAFVIRKFSSLKLNIERNSEQSLGISRCFLEKILLSVLRNEKKEKHMSRQYKFGPCSKLSQVIN